MSRTTQYNENGHNFATITIDTLIQKKDNNLTVRFLNYYKTSTRTDLPIDGLGIISPKIAQLLLNDPILFQSMTTQFFGTKKIMALACQAALCSWGDAFYDRCLTFIKSPYSPQQAINLLLKRTQDLLILKIILQYYATNIDANTDKIKLIFSRFPNLDSYCIDLRRNNPIEALIEIIDSVHCSPGKDHQFHINSPRSKKAITKRLQWSNIVSATNQIREKQENEVRTAVINRLTKLGYQNPDSLYNRCLSFLANHSVIVFTFNASKIKDLKYYESLNTFEIKELTNTPDTRNKTYPADRDKTERLQYSFLPYELGKKFYDNLNIRPCYATLYLTGPKHVPVAITKYGKSFLALRPLIKFTTLFVAHDTMNFQKSGSYVNLEPCSIHYLGKILQHCGDKKLRNIVNRAQTGAFLPGFSQQMSHAAANDLLDYIEAHIPNFNFLNPDMVSHAHLDEKEIGNNLKQTKNLLESHGITVTHGSCSPYGRLKTEIFNKISQNDFQGVKQLIRKFPALLAVVNENAQDPLLFAASLGHHKCITALAPFHPYPNMLDKNGKSALHLAVEIGSEPSVAALLQLKDIDINIQTHMPGNILDGATPVFMASYLDKSPISILILFIKHGADTSLATSNGQTPLTTTTWYNLTDRINLILATKNTNINSKVAGSHTALTNAITKCDNNTISKIISVPDMKLEDRPGLLSLLSKQSKRISIEKNILCTLMVFLQGTRQQGHSLYRLGRGNLISALALVFPIIKLLITDDETLFLNCFEEKIKSTTNIINQYNSGLFHWRPSEAKELCSDLETTCNNPQSTPHRKNLQINICITGFFSKWSQNSSKYRRSKVTQLLHSAKLIPKDIKIEKHPTEKGYFRLLSS